MAAANGKNPIVILIPCHRIIGSKGELTGYSGGIERKRSLLRLERKYSGQKDLFNP
jgi:methylated-DNA-[protein]-cysteine S-methyltransferase